MAPQLKSNESIFYFLVIVECVIVSTYPNSAMNRPNVTMAEPRNQFLWLEIITKSTLLQEK